MQNTKNTIAKYWYLFGALLIVSCSGKNISELPLTEKPNILLIVSEDNGPDLGSYGVKEVTTPYLDSLALKGVKFNNAYVTYSVCSPSRSSIFTGLYPHQNGQIGLATHKYRMYRSFKTLPVYLKEVGYRTGCLGKIHVNPESAIPWDFHPIKGSNFAKKNLPGYAEKAGEFINSSKEPFFLMVNFPDAHYPLQKQVEGMPANPIDGKDIDQPLPFVGVDSERLRTFTANYYNSMNRLDEAVGMLLAKLKSSGKADNTLIIYLGDHGAQFSRGKCSNYEGGLKIPFIVNWPGKAVGPQERSELISIIDILPTLLEVADIELPKDLPGKSLVPFIEGKVVSDWREYVFAGGAGSSVMFYYPRRSVRNERYKLIANLLHERENPKFRFYADHRNVHFSGGTDEAEISQSSAEIQQVYETWKNPPAFELYDLKHDSLEFHNLCDDPKYQSILEELQSVLAQWQSDTNDPFANPEKLAKFTAEVEAINTKYPDHSYTKVEDFQWKYPDYFYQEEKNAN